MHVKPFQGPEVSAPGNSELDNVRPSISVIVATYLRREFIVDAVRSVFGSGLSPDQVDVVVTKGYPSTTQDEELRQLGARIILDPESNMGQRLWRAIPMTHARLVAFLDDDDLFEATRLEHVCRIFDTHPGVGFYRNRVTLIDRAGEPVPRELYGAMELDPLLDRTGPLDSISGSHPTDYHLLRKGFPWFNTSAMVLRRELLTGPFGHLLESADFAPDVRLYLIALLSGTGLYIDDQRLTRYRASSPTWSELARRSWGELAAVKVSSELAQRLTQPPWPAQFRTLVRNSEMRAVWSEFVSRIEQRRPRVEVISAFLEYIDSVVRHPRAIRFDPSRFFYLVCAGAYLADPTSGSAILRNASITPSISRTRRRAVRGDSLRVK